MSLNKPIMALILSLLIAFSFLAFIQLEKNGSAHNLTSVLSSSFVRQSAFEDISKEIHLSVLSNSTRADIYEYIVANPGVQFKGICAGLSIAIGTAEFHLGVLKRAGLICFFRDGKYKRFFVSRKFSLKEMKLLCILRHETTRNIIKKLDAEKIMNHSKLANSLCISSQGLTWQMNRLVEEGIIQEHFEGIKLTYRITETYTGFLPYLFTYFE